MSGLEGAWQIGSTRVRIGVGLSAGFPLRLPDIFHLSHGEEALLPHVEEDGRICCFDREGLVLDRHRPAQILRETLAQARRTIEAGMKGENRLELFDECESYWWATRQRLHCNVAPDEVARKIIVFHGIPSGVAADRGALEEMSPLFRNGTWSEQNGLYVPLEPSLLSDRDFHPGDIDSDAALHDLMETHVSAANRERLGRARHTRGYKQFLILGIPRAAGGRALLGLWLDAPRSASRRRRIRSHELRGSLSRVALVRADPHALQGRLVTAPSVKGAHVVIVGCGALGGHLASCLAWAGVGRLTLVDPDPFLPTNTFRHVLGRSGVGTQSKVFALKQELETKIPRIEITDVASNFEVALRDGVVKLDGSSLVVVTTGDVTGCLGLNAHLVMQPLTPAVIYAWIEPHGLGGHAVLTNTRKAGASGCFECLFEDDPEFGLVNRADYAAPGQRFASRDRTCSSAFVPYGDLDARETANLAARLAIETLDGRVLGHPLRSWRGDATAFHGAGFRTSARYDRQSVGQGTCGSSYAREGCRCCGGRST
ncbi:ThiF family adenylyltransferase [Chondromyces crocatus]|uniref:ThiF family adenylyltransferase n=1 Tax=Chondromyces crocatus TaxID=52 RepID=UPI0012E262D2|nr:E2/UBC family protein [Chondromyces crocatus]